ncbi:MAG: hypothetical protein AAGA48_05075 [Myxococcota bacterium]
MWGLCMVMALAEAAEVRLEKRRWPLLFPDDSTTVSPPPPPMVLPGTASLDTQRWLLDVTNPVVAPRDGYLIVPVAPRQVTLDRVTVDGKDVPVTLQGDAWVAAFPVDGAAELRVRSFVPPRTSVLQTPAGAALTVVGTAYVTNAPKVKANTWWVGPRTTLQATPPPRQAQGTVVLGESAVGLTVRDASLAAKARLRFRVARGAVKQVVFTMAQVPADLELEGDQMAGLQVQGNRVVVTLARPERSLVDLQATWTSDLPPGADAQVSVSLPALQGIFRETTALQIARDTDREVLPAPIGMTPVVASALPPWARGLVDGAPTAAYLGSQAARARLQLLRTTLVDQPPTVIDVIESEVATSASGGLLLRSRLAVRNDRGAFLTVRPPPGMRLVSARVKGKTALVTELDDGQVLVPLARSVQSVQGSLSFPVELAYLGTTEPWPKRGEMVVALPAYDAPVAVHRARLGLPPGVHPRVEIGKQGVVDEFTEGNGINYGFRDGDGRASQADALLQGAVDAWLDNRFDLSQQYVDQLDAIGADNADVSRLRSNLAVVQGPSEEEASEVTQAEKAATRRLKSLARARAERDLIEQRQAVDEADEYLAKGDYKNARRSYESALAIGDRLERIAAEEDVVQQTQNTDIRQKLSDLSTTTGAPATRTERMPKAEPAEAPLPPLIVQATTASVLVPLSGTEVRFQRVLLPANETPTLTLCVRKPRRNP